MTETTRAPVVLTRDYEATPSQIFAAWTDVELLTKWYGCDVDMLWTVHAWEPKTGGALHVSLDFDGTPFEVHGNFIEVDEPNRLRYEWRPPDTDKAQMITVTIEAIANGSRMTVEHAGLPSEEFDQIVTGGWTASMGQILRALDAIAADNAGANQ